MALHYILDGYNIVHKIPSLRSNSAQKSRNKLIKHIQIKKPQGSLKNKVTVVFDGTMDGGDRPGDTYPVEVIFTHQMSADDYIIQMIKNSTNPKIIVVVSDDREVQGKTLLLDAKVVEVKKFLMDYKSNKDETIKPSLTNLELDEIKEELLRKGKKESGNC